VVALLAPRWSGDGEAVWFTRQVARALLRYGDVHVITLEGPNPEVTEDRRDEVSGARCMVHRLGTPPATRHVARREVLLAALSAVEAQSGQPNGPSVERLLRRGMVEPWELADKQVAQLCPDLMVLADYRQVGALEVRRRSAPAVPLVLLPLADGNPAVSLAHFDQMFAEAAVVLAATHSEFRAVTQASRAAHRDPDRVHVVGLPAIAGPLAQPRSDRSGRSGVLVFTGHRAGDHDLPAALARLLALALPRTPVAVVSTDALTTWRGGVPSHAPVPAPDAVTSEWMAKAAVTVDLRPGGFLARRCVDSLACGTAIVVAADSRGREYAESGRGGLWFSPPGELIWCVEAILDPAVHGRFGAQGRNYVESVLGTPSDFASRVVEAIGLDVRNSGAPAGSRDWAPMA
jgi:hypothetical protein